MKRSLGITLLDLLCTISISSVLAFVGVPSLSDFLKKAQANSVSHALHSASLGARNLAIIEEKPITVCGLDEQNRCKRANIRSMISFFDENRDGVLDPGERMYSATDLKHRAELTLRMSFNRSYIRFTSEGYSELSGSFIYCDPSANNAARRVTVSLAGRTYKARDTDGDGVVELVNGNPITC